MTDAAGEEKWSKKEKEGWFGHNISHICMASE